MTKFAEILVHKQKVYTYQIPAELTATAEIGQEVTVSLRGKNTNGYIIKFVEKPIFKTLAVKELVSATSYFDDKLVALAEFIAQKYKCLFATAIKPILPKE